LSICLACEALGLIPSPAKNFLNEFNKYLNTAYSRISEIKYRHIENTQTEAHREKIMKIKDHNIRHVYDQKV
jgi:hypothetical protein